MTAAKVKVEEKQVETEVKAVVEETIEKDESKPVVVEKIVSFKEESNFFSDLKETEKKALSDLKLKLEEAIVGNTLFKTKKEDESKKDDVIATEEKEKEKEKTEAVPQERKALSNLRSRLEEAIAGNTLFKKKKKEKKEEENKTEDTKAEETKTEEKEEEKKTEETKTEEKKTEETKTGETKTEETKTEEKKTEEKEEEKKAEEKVEETKEDEVKITEEETKTEEIPKGEVKAENIEEVKAKEEHEVEEEDVVDKEIALWGVPLLPSKGSEATDVILLKFLRARDFKVDESFEMLKKTLIWRKHHNIDSILNEDFGEDLASAAYINGVDRESHPVCYNLHSVFENEELYQTTFTTEKNREKFLRWRFQQMEKGIQKLDLKPGGVTSLLQIHDLKNSPGLTRKEVRIAIKQAIEALQDNYPEFVSRNIFINVPFWFYALNALMSPFLTQRTKSKFVVARPVKVTETLLKYIPAEEIPIEYGGFKRENDLEFSGEEVTEVFVKPGSSETIEIPLVETGTTLVWDIVVLGWEVSYKEEFVPADEGSYTMIVQKEKKIGSNEGLIRNSFKNSESGKIVITVGNVSSKKKRVLYRYKTKVGSSF